MVDALRREERVVDIGVEPTYYYIVECRAVVSAWPMVAGITGPDWELVGQPQSASSRAGSLAHKMSEMYDMWNAEQGRTMRQVIWATRASTRVSDLYREYFAFVVDERVPLGMMQLAVRV